MAIKKRAKRSGTRVEGTFATLRRRAEAMMSRVRKAGMQQVRALERQIERLNQQRQELLADIGLSMGGGGPGAKGKRGPSTGRGHRSRVDWDHVFAKLPKTSFKASDVRVLAPGVSAGTLSQRLTGWVEEKKLKRTGSRRGTRYTRSA